MKSINYKSALVPVIILLITWSCIEEVSDINLPSSQPKLVIYSFITPGDSIKVRVYKSTPLFAYQEFDEYLNRKFPPIANATVTINDELGNNQLIPFQQEDQSYTIEPTLFNIESGKTYYLTVSASDFETVTANTMIPTFTTTIREIEVYTTQFRYSEELVIQGYIEDQQGINNYYRLNAYPIIISDPWSSQSFENNLYFTDTKLDGNNLNFRIKIEDRLWDSIAIVAINCDYNYYNYHNSLQKHSSSNPFAEPTPVLSNVRNGIGVFGSYTRTELVIPMGFRRRK